MSRLFYHNGSTLKVREAGDGSRTIEGYVIKWDVRSVLLHDAHVPYYETLQRNCLTKETLDKCNIPLTMFHDRELVIARSKNGKGTLSYRVDNVGVWFSADVARTADGDKAIELVRRGDICGCSFVYSTDEMDPDAVDYLPSGETDEYGHDIPLRIVKRIDTVSDFTLTYSPAYQQTTVSAREREAMQHGIKAMLVRSVKDGTYHAGRRVIGSRCPSVGREMTAQKERAVNELRSKSHTLETYL